MKRLLAVLVILLFIGSSFTISNEAGEGRIRNEKVIAKITYKSNECSIATLQPIVVITSPADGAVVTDPHLTVLGYAMDEIGMNYWEWEWRWKGGSKSNSSYFETAEYVEFKIDIYGLHPGWNLIIVRFKNIYGAMGEDNVNVTYVTENNPPNKPSKPEGPTKGKVKTTLYYSTVTTDPDGDSLEYLIDWGDGTNTGWLGPITSGTPFQTFHAWDEPGTYEVKAKARDLPYLEESDWSEPLIVTIYGEENHPPDTPTQPEGPTEGAVGESLRYESYFSDPDGDSLEVMFDWGDGTNTGWVGPVASGTTVGNYHTYTSPGTYQVRTKARDIPYLEESEWSEPLIVIITGEENDTEPPVVVKKYPPDGATFTESNITAWGYITDNVGVVSYGYTHEWEGGATGSSWPLEESTTNYSFEIPLTLHEGWNKIKVEASDAAGNYGYDEETVWYDVNATNIDLDIVWPKNDTKLVPDNKEEDKRAHVPGRALSLNREKNHLKKIYVRSPAEEKFTLEWSDGLEIYENKDKTGKVAKGTQYTAPRGFWVEAIKRSKKRNDQWVEAILVKNKANKDRVVFTNFEVKIKIRTFGKISENNDKRKDFAKLYGEKLGLIDKIGKDIKSRVYGIVEIVGTFIPSGLNEKDFWKDEFYWRRNKDYNRWVNDKLQFHFLDDPSDPLTNDQDTIPDKGKLYALDADLEYLPSNGGDIYASRWRFKVWCSFKYHEEDFGKKQDPHNKRNDGYRVCSVSDAYYILRLTLRKDGRDSETCDSLSAKYRGNLLYARSKKPDDDCLYYDVFPFFIISKSPKSAKLGEIFTLTIKGKRFVKTPTILLTKSTLKGSRTIEARNIIVKSKNEIECEFIIPEDYPTGGYLLRIIGPRIDNDADGTPEKPFEKSRGFRIDD